MNRDIVNAIPGADPENVEPGGANSINYQTEPGAQIYFLVLHIRPNRGRAPGAPPSKSAPAYHLFPYIGTDSSENNNLTAAKTAALTHSDCDSGLLLQLDVIHTKLHFALQKLTAETINYNLISLLI